MTKSLEIHITSAEGLKVNKKLIKQNTFAVVKIGEKSLPSNLNLSGGENSNPTWNYKTETEIDILLQFIFIEVFYRTGSGRDKKIGEAKIPTNDFMGRYSPQGHLNILSYRLRDEYGDKCGIVNVSIMVKPNSSEYGDCSSEVRTESLPCIDGYGGRIVTGVPVWCVMRQQS
ncbi:hypothetical protein AALP_AA5G268700 [Arabis alpina]|uniref:C2 domain-containing protein n=1 Tax=Arabis alpina TaxID=50452 RepID=A0A087GZL5_ARAAL|nr:hypothetical protein AALP_AA5G268700 [Arabis alpina]